MTGGCFAALAMTKLIAEVVEAERQVGDVLANQGHGGLQVVAFCASDAYRITLNRPLDFEFAVKGGRMGAFLKG
jgi:hypothetical protein